MGEKEEFECMDTSEFKLEQLFGSKTRARLLGLFLSQPKTKFFVRELTRKIDAQLNSVRRELKNLVELGAVVEVSDGIDASKKKTLSEKKKYYRANTDFILFEDLASLFQKVQILLKQNIVQEIKQHGTVDFFAFTGRFCGVVDQQTDMIIVGSIPEDKLLETISSFEKEVGHEVNFTLMTKDEFIYRRQLTDRFLTSILNQKKIVVVDNIGDEE